MSIALATTTLTAVLCGTIPAIRLTAGHDVGGLRTRVIGADSPRLTIGRVLIAVQIAISMPLLVGALLFLQTLHNLASVNLGFDARGLVTFQINPPVPNVGTAATRNAPGPAGYARLARDVLQAIDALPGVVDATLVENPLVSGITSNAQATIGGQVAKIAMEAIGPQFFETMQIPVTSGRTIIIHDDAQAPSVAVVNRLAAQTFFGRTAFADRPDDHDRQTITRDCRRRRGLQSTQSLRREPRPMLLPTPTCGPTQPGPTRPMSRSARRSRRRPWRRRSRRRWRASAVTCRSPT